MKTLSLTQALINCPSITPNDAGCQNIIKAALAPYGFQFTDIPCGKVSNLWAVRGDKKPLFVFAGHTDVVPPGPLSEWKFPPFEATVNKGDLYGRGAADMKSAIAAMVAATQTFLTQSANFSGSIGFILTSNEEGADNSDGTIKVLEYLEKHDVHIDFALVGEASSQKKLGDSIKVGRRGSLSAKLTIHGQQGHVAFPEKAQNPIHLSLPVLTELSQISWDNGNEFFPPTQFQYTHFLSGDPVFNVIPGKFTILLNFRYNNLQNANTLRSHVEHVLTQHRLKFNIEWTHGAQPFLTHTGHLTAIIQSVAQDILNLTPTFSTDGGTSDARFIAPLGTEVIELGLINQTIHQVNEHVAIADIEKLSEVYLGILKKILIPKPLTIVSQTLPQAT